MNIPLRHCLFTYTLFSMGMLLGLAQHQTTRLDNPKTPNTIPYQLELRQVELSGEVPTLHSYAAAHYDGLWLMIAGRTNGLHGMTGRNAFDPAFENRNVWVIDPSSGATWHKSLENTAAGNLSTDIIDSLSSVNTQFTQTGSYLLITGGYGFRRSIANHTTYATLTVIDIPALMNWVQAPQGTETSLAADHIQQIQDDYFKVTGGGLERIGDKYQLIFGQNYEGAYRPFLNGIHTQQVRRFQLASFQPLALLPDSKRATTPHPDFRRRDLNVQPLLEKQQSYPFALIEKAMVLGGVFTLEGGGWTLPVIIAADGEVSQQIPEMPGTLHQSVQPYHCVKVSMFHSISEEMHTVLFGGISLKYWDETAQDYLTDENLPFVNDVTSVVRYHNGSIQQFRMPFLFPKIMAPWDNNKQLRFGTNAEFFPDPQIPRLTSKVIDLAAIRQSSRLGWIHGGIIADAPNSGVTAASGYVFEVWLHPEDIPTVASEISVTSQSNSFQLNWNRSAQRIDQLQQSPDLLNWHQYAPITETFDINPIELTEESSSFFRIISAIQTSPIE